MDMAQSQLSFSFGLHRIVPGIGERRSQETLTFDSEACFNLLNFRILLDVPPTKQLQMNEKLIETDEDLLNALKSEKCELEYCDVKQKFVTKKKSNTNRRSLVVIGSRKSLLANALENPDELDWNEEDVTLSRPISIDKQVLDLFDAIKVDAVQQLEEFLQVHGEVAELNMIDKKGRTLIHCAVQARAIKCVRKLAKVSVIDINALDSFGWTALHYAVNMSTRELVEALFRNKNLKVNVITPEGKRPHDLAKTQEIAAFLEAFTPLHDKPKEKPKEKSKEKAKEKSLKDHLRKSERHESTPFTSSQSSDDNTSEKDMREDMAEWVSPTPKEYKKVPASFKENLESNFKSLGSIEVVTDKPKVVSPVIPKFDSTQISSQSRRRGRTQLFDDSKPNSEDNHSEARKQDEEEDEEE